MTEPIPRWFGTPHANCRLGYPAAGKSSLVAELAAALPHYRVVEEPYVLLVEEGHELADPPSVEDLELQLERSLELARTPERDVLFDRCPADFLGYLFAHPEADDTALPAWLRLAADAMAGLDLVVFVPIERPDRIDLDRSEDLRLRRNVDRRLRELLVEDVWGLGARVFQVRGSVGERAGRVLAHLRGLGEASS